VTEDSDEDDDDIIKHNQHDWSWDKSTRVTSETKFGQCGDNDGMR
jgi:hypothetical protein